MSEHMERAVKQLDGRETRNRKTTVIPNVCKAPPALTDDQYAAYLAGEYRMLMHFVSSGEISPERAAATIGRKTSDLMGMRHVWRTGNIAEQCRAAAGMLRREMKGMEAAE